MKTAAVLLTLDEEIDAARTTNNRKRLHSVIAMTKRTRTSSNNLGLLRWSPAT